MDTTTATLTKRESEVAELIAWGATKKEVANKLHVSERTIENHARSIYEKTGVTKSNELSAWWFCKTYQIPRLMIIKVIIIGLLLAVSTTCAFMFKEEVSASFINILKDLL